MLREDYAWCHERVTTYTWYVPNHLLNGVLVVLLNTHIQPTHFLRAWICWCAWDIIISISLSPNSLSVCILCMTSTMLRPLASYTHTPVLPSVCTYVHPCLGQYYTVLPRSLLLHVCVPHIPIHILCMCTCVLYSTRSIPYTWYSAASYTSPRALISTYPYTCP